jgi:hypothetical protein
MANTQVQFLQPFFYCDTPSDTTYTIKVDQAVAQMNGFLVAELATALINLGLAVEVE